MTVSALRLPKSGQIGSPKVKLSRRGRSKAESGVPKKMTQKKMPKSQWTMTMKMREVLRRMHMSLTSLTTERMRR